MTTQHNHTHGEVPCGNNPALQAMAAGVLADMGDASEEDKLKALSELARASASLPAETGKDAPPQDAETAPDDPALMRRYYEAIANLAHGDFRALDGAALTDVVRVTDLRFAPFEVFKARAE